MRDGVKDFPAIVVVEQAVNPPHALGTFPASAIAKRHASSRQGET
jgi:hypothetical protein